MTRMRVALAAAALMLGGVLASSHATPDTDTAARLVQSQPSSATGSLPGASALSADTLLPPGSRDRSTLVRRASEGGLGLPEGVKAAALAPQSARHGKCTARSFLYKNTIRGTHFITASSDAWCDQKQKKLNVHVALWRLRWYGWQLLGDSDDHAKNVRSNYAMWDYPCKPGSSYSWKMHAWVTVDGGGIGAKPPSQEKFMTC